MPTRVMFFRPTLGSKAEVGGADRATLTILQHLDRTRYAPSLAMLRAEGPFVADVPADVRIHTLGARRLATSVPALAALLRRERPEVLFSTCSASNIIAFVAHQLARSDARLVLSERNAVYRGRSRLHVKQSLEVALKLALYRHADLVTAVSRGLAEQLRDRIGVPAEKVSVVYNPVVSEQMLADARAPVPHPWFAEALPIIVACSRMVPQKDYPCLLRVFARVRERVPSRLVIVGDGPLRAAIEQDIRDLGLSEHVHVVGFDKNPFRYMARATVFLQTSHAEGLPGTIIQAMALGTPVVSTDCDFGPREVIHHGVDGFLCPIGDVVALADRVVEILASPERRTAMGRAAAAACAEFVIGASMRRYQAAIDGVRVEEAA